MFYRVVAQLLFVSQRERRDLQTTGLFLTTRVKKPVEDNWGKLQHVILYIKGTLSFKLTLSADNLSVVKWWINADYAVHEDYKGHTGAMMTLGKGACTSEF